MLQHECLQFQLTELAQFELSHRFKLIRITPLDTSTSPVPITLERTAVPDPNNVSWCI